MEQPNLIPHLNKTVRAVSVETDSITLSVCKAFDYDFDGTITFEGYSLPDLSADYDIGLIVGPSGSGKSTLLKEIGEQHFPEWARDKAIVSHFSASEEAIERLGAVGLNSIPTWLKPYHVLSTGEKFRADLSRQINDNAVIDEFTSVVDRTVAKAASVALRRYADKHKINRLTLASCHYDIIEWLRPSWVFDTGTGTLRQGRSLRRPDINLDLFEGARALWPLFKEHHYLTEEINDAARCFAAFWGDHLVGFASSLPLPSGTVKNAWREHRTVILPDFQGLGMGVRLSDAVAQIHLDEGRRYYSKTVHFRMGGYRDASPLWRQTSGHMKIPADHGGKLSGWVINKNRMAYSHEYVGDPEARAQDDTHDTEEKSVSTQASLFEKF